ncbi:hypothetical protein EB796_017845 [Bugula neritina]|uniref:G-protein coupled receptors family 1 profile domain-containing protein n=1 Tax=Bugula neritina TaxID=10212 RepID=A0A7J7JE16_BUGNE|nr:hypothetical protein EB796_017845 [Bugula neritina]
MTGLTLMAIVVFVIAYKVDKQSGHQNLLPCHSGFTTCLAQKTRNSVNENVSLVLFIIPMVVIGFIYISIIYVLHRQQSSVSLQSQAAKKLKSSTRSMGFLSLTFIISYLPIIMLKIFAKIESIKSADIRAYRASYTVLYMNGFINPIVYALSNKEYRETAKRLLRLRSVIKVATAPPEPTTRA